MRYTLQEDHSDKAGHVLEEHETKWETMAIIPIRNKKGLIKDNGN